MSESVKVPNTWKSGAITQKGLGLLAKLITGHTLDITRAVTGAGFVDPDLLEQQTEVLEPMQEMTFNPVSYPAEGKCCISCQVTNEKVTKSYVARQIGVYANDPDEGEILYYIVQVENENGGTGIPAASLIPSYSSTWNLVILYGMADGVNVTVDPAGTITREEAEHIIDEAVDEMAEGVGSAIIVPITIPAAGWVAVGEGAEGLGDYLYTIDVAIADCLDAHFPAMALNIPSLAVATAAGLCPTIETLDGIVRFWAMAIPTADLSGTICLRSPNLLNSGTTGDGNIATDEEVDDAVDDVFGDGTTSGGGSGTGGTESGGESEGDSPNVDDSNIATDKEVEDMVNGIFGNQ